MNLAGQTLEKQALPPLPTAHSLLPTAHSLLPTPHSPLPTPHFYQLTHDYLVPSLHKWLTRKQRESKRGRAELRLAERSEVWNAKPENRRLPSLWEFLNVRWLTSKKDWSAPQQRMMRKAAGYYGLRTAIVALILAAMGVLGAESLGRLEARVLVNRLLEATTANVPAVVREMHLYRRWTRPLLEDALAEAAAAGDATRRLHSSLALLPEDPGQTPFLYEQMLEAGPDDFPVLRDALAAHRERLVPALWTVFEAHDPSPERRFRAGCALAQYDPDHQDWSRIAPDVAEQLVRQNALVFAKWGITLQPVSAHLLGPLSEIFRDRSDQRRVARSLASMILVDYAADTPTVLVELLLHADHSQVGLLLPVIQRHATRAANLLHRELSKEPDPDATQEQRNQLAQRQANAAGALLALGRPDRVWPLLEFRRDPRVRSYLIHRLDRFLADPKPLMDRVEDGTDASVRAAAVMSLGELADQKFSASERESLTARLLQLYRDDPDPAVHGSAAWTLRRWNQGAKVDEADQALAAGKLEGRRGWYVTSQGETMVVVRGPVEAVQIRAPAARLQRKRINRSFAIAAREVSLEQFHQFVNAIPTAARLHTEYQFVDPKLSQGLVNWFEAAAYCRWLSERDGIPEDQMCYPPIPEIKDGMKMPANYLQRTGYRLPTEAEWSYSCRAGTVMPYYFGYPENFRGDDELLEKYVWHFWNSPDHPSPGGMLKPNDLGLFDMLGNVMEWTQDGGLFNKEGAGASSVDDVEDPSPVTGAHRVLRGFSMFDKPRDRPAEEDIPSLADSRQLSFGFRVARTLPEPEFAVIPGDESSLYRAELSIEGIQGPLAVQTADSDIVVTVERADSPVVLTASGPELFLRPVSFTVERTAANEAYQVLGTLAPDGLRAIPILKNSIGMKLAWIPPGEFLMGAGEEELEQAVRAEAQPAFVPFRRSEGPRHRARITRPFWLGAHEVTVGQFRQFAEVTGYRTEPERDGHIVEGLIDGKWQPHKPGYHWREPGFPQTGDHPVVLVTWNDAVEFCRWLGRQENETYRLPTEAEWEYACRAGSTSRWCFGDDEEQFGAYAWYHGNSGLVPHAVGQKLPNDFGLHDVHGNVWEWCADGWSADYYQRSPVDDPPGPDGDQPRILRSGNVWGAPIDGRSAFRLADAQSGRGNVWGFRVVRSVADESSPPSALKLRLDRPVVAVRQAEFRILGADTPFAVQDVQGGVEVAPLAGKAPAVIKVCAPDHKARPYSFVVKRTDTGQTTTVSGLLFAPSWSVKYYAWTPTEDGAPPTDWEQVIVAPPLDQQTLPVLDLPGSARRLGAIVPGEHVAAVATSQLELPAGRYDVWATADDGVRIFIDGRKLIDQWSPGPSSQLVEVRLGAGQHTVRAEYYQRSGTARLQVGLRPFSANGAPTAP